MSVSSPATNISRTTPTSARTLNTLATETPSGPAGRASSGRDQISSRVGPNNTPAKSSPRMSGKPIREVMAPATLATRMITAMLNRICSDVFIDLLSQRRSDLWSGRPPIRWPAHSREQRELWERASAGPAPVPRPGRTTRQSAVALRLGTIPSSLHSHCLKAPPNAA